MGNNSPGGGGKAMTNTNNTGTPNWSGNNLAMLGNAMMGGGAPNPNAPQGAPTGGTGPGAPPFSPYTASPNNNYRPPAMATPATGAAASPYSGPATGGAFTGAPGVPTYAGAGPDPNSNPSGYNALNTQLQTAPMQAITSEIQSGGMNPMTGQATQNLLNTTGSNNWMGQSAGQFNALGSPQGTANYQGVYNTAGGPGANQQNLANMAAGGMVGQSNPYTTAIARQAEQDAMSGVNQMFAAGGRYGSGMDQGSVAKAIADANNQWLGQQYNTDVTNQLSANNQISQEQIGRLGAQNTAAQGVGQLQQWGAQGLGSLGQNAMNNYLQAQANAGQLGNTATSNMNNAFSQLGSVQANKLFDATQQMGIGNQAQQAQQQQLTDWLNQYNTVNMAPWTGLSSLASLGGSVAGNYGTQTGQTTQTSRPGIGDILGTIANLL